MSIAGKIGYAANVTIFARNWGGLRMPYTIARYAGYCAGVRKAMEIALRTAKEAKREGYHHSTIFVIIFAREGSVS